MSARRSHEEVKARAIQVALQLFADHGYEATSIQRIASGMHMSKQALMHHFPSKELLRAGVYALIEQRFALAFQVLSEGIATQPVDLIDRFAVAFESAPLETRFILRELLDAPEQTSAWLWEHGAPLLDVVESIKPEKLDVDPPAQAIATSAFMLMSATFLGALPPSWRDRVRRAGTLMIKRGSDPSQSFLPPS